MNPLYLSFSSLFNGGSVEETKTLVTEKFVPILTANWTTWPFIQLANFKFIPPMLQVPVMNVCIVFWSAYLAINANEKNTKTDQIQLIQEDKQEETTKD